MEELKYTTAFDKVITKVVLDSQNKEDMLNRLYVLFVKTYNESVAKDETGEPRFKDFDEFIESYV